MGRAALELALRDAGVGGHLAIALSADLAEARGGDIDIAEEAGQLFQARGFREARAMRDLEPEPGWDMPFLVADADLCDGFGDLCGRRVA